MPDNQIGLEAVFENSDFQKGIKEYNQATADADKKTASAGSAMSKVWDGLANVGAVALQAIAAAVAAASVAIGAFVISASKDFIEFEKNLSEVFTLLPGLTQEAMQDMSGDLLEFTSDMGVLTEKAIPALYQAISAGVPKENVFEFLRVAQMAAVGGVTELETAVDGISSVVNAYGADVLGAAQASDFMFTAVRLGKTTFDELSNSLFQVIPTAASLGVNFGDVSAALAAMTSQGVPTSVATTQLRQLFVELSKEGSNAAKTFESLSGKSFGEFISAGGNVADALLIMEDGASKSGKKISDMFGSVEAGNAALALTGKGFDTFTKNIDAMAESTGATEAAFDTMEKTSARTIERMKAKFESIKINLADKLDIDAILLEIEKLFNSPEVQEGIEALGGLFAILGENIRDFSATVLKEIPNIVDNIKALPDWFEDNQPLIVGVLAAIGVAIAAFAITVISSALSAAAALAPILLAMALIGGAVALLYTAWTENWGGIQEHVGALWATIQPILQGLFEWLQVNIPIALQFLGDLWTNTLLPAIQVVWSWVASNLIPLFTTLVEWLQVNVPAAISTVSTLWTGTLLPAIQAVWAWISTNLIPLFTAISDLMSTVMTIAITALAGLWQNVLQPALETVWTWLSTNLMPIFQSLADTVTNNVLPALKPLAEFFSVVLKTAFDGITNAIQKLIGWINDLTEALGNVELPPVLTPGSPTPFELGLRGINDELKRMAMATLPAVRHEMNLTASVRDVPGANQAGSARVVNNSNSTNNYLFGAQFSVNNSNGLLEILSGLS